MSEGTETTSLPVVLHQFSKPVNLPIVLQACEPPNNLSGVQTDIHSPTVTVYESLIFSARLRLPAGQSDEKASQHGFVAFTAPNCRLHELSTSQDSQIGES